MVVTFVGFIGGWHSSPDAPFTESSHGKLQFTAPLTAISAAVVGIITSLAVFFAQHTLWYGHPDWHAPLLTGTAAVALFAYNRSVIQIIVVSALLGLALHTFI